MKKSPLPMKYDPIERLPTFLLQHIYSLLYHQFAWAYDFIAAVVSLGKWNNWVQTILPFSNGRVLELGFGTGRLQRSFFKKGILAVGVDESREMIIKSRRFLRKNFAPLRLIRGYAQSLPIRNECFDTVVSTFPAEYIFDPGTILEIRRVLLPTGKFILLPTAWITGTSFSERLLAWLLRFIGYTREGPGSISTAFKDQFLRVGFEVDSEVIGCKGSQVLIIKAQKLPGF
jgi:ubiquinone/menaquinone biosynthesis C-methylase UbiE